VVALENIVALKIGATEFLDVLKAFSETSLPLAQELAKRLYQRNSTIRVPNESAKLFIISSSEAKEIAHALRDGLGKDIFTTVWDQGVFFAGGYPLEALENMVAESDFAVAIAEPDDITQSRGVSAKTVRDNVLFELGLFMGKLTRYRSILVHPRVKDLKLPSDLQGLTLVPYEDGDKATVATRLAPVCDQISELIKKLGTRKFTIE
jgi:predicted nucleotide-binding protein